MAINWNNVAAPNLGESNSLFAQAIASLKDAGAGLKDTAKDYQTVVRNKSHAILQDYINSAKTPEELQSEAFNTGFKNLQATLANEYDAVKVNDYRDSAVDKLTKRAGDAVALKRNTLGLATDQQAVDTNDMMNRIFTAPESERPALIAEAVKLNRFDAKGMLTNQVGNAQLTQATNANDLFKVQKPFLEVQPKLANEATIESTAASQARTRNAARELELKAQELEIARKKAASEGSGKFNFGTSPQGLITKTEESIRNFEATLQGDKAKARGDNSKNAQTWYKEQQTVGDVLDGVPKTLFNLAQGKYGKKNLIKGWGDLSPNEQHTALANTYARSGLDAEWNVSDKDFEQLKGTLQNEVSSALKGDVNKRDAYAFAQIDNLLGEVYYRDPTVSKEAVFNTLNIDKNLKSAYLKHKQEQAATAEATNNVVQAGAKPASVIVPTVKKPQVTLGESLNGGSAWSQPKQPQNTSTPSIANSGNSGAQLLQNTAGYFTVEQQEAAHWQRAKEGKLDAVTADRYVAELEAQLKEGKLDPIDERPQVLEMLKVYKANQKNAFRQRGSD